MRLWQFGCITFYSRKKKKKIRNRAIDFDLSTAYIKNSLKLDSPEMKRIQKCALENDMIVSLGYSERDDGNSLYIAQCTILSDGTIAMTRRKMKGSHVERTLFGDANSFDVCLKNVVETSIGKVGALNCWVS
jgi:predicted amidohydrolase